jgi:4-hydroxybenzoate polyprenyltransferase
MWNATVIRAPSASAHRPSRQAELGSIRPARLLSLRFLRAYIVTMRPYLLYVSGITGIAGLSLAPRLSAASSLVVGLAFFLSYGFGQALTDCFQLDTDSLSAPYRPLVRGEIRRGHVMWVSLSGLIAIGVTLAVYNRWNIPLAIAAVAGLATYTYFKRRWWAGPFYNAWIVAVLALIGYLCGTGGAGTQLAWSLGLAGTMAAVFFGYANFVLTGYYKDVSADRATGYRTFPVAFGLQASGRVSHALATAALLGAALAVFDGLVRTGIGLGQTAAVGLFAAGVAAVVLAQLRLTEVEDEITAHRAITPVVHAYVLLLAAIAAAQKPEWSPALVALYLAFVVTMRRRPMKEQI